jgi:Spy/CpxP family protein refolding chaperone
MRSLMMALSLAALAGSGLPAQDRPMQHGGGKGQGQGMMMGEGGILKAIMPFAPEALLKHGDHLQLTAEQVAKLTELKDKTTVASKNAHDPAHAAHMSLNEALKTAPDDTTAIRQYFMAHETAKANTMWVRASAAFQARALLTAEQRAMVESMAKDAKGHQH